MVLGSWLKLPGLINDPDMIKMIEDKRRRVKVDNGRTEGSQQGSETSKVSSVIEILD